MALRSRARSEPAAARSLGERGVAVHVGFTWRLRRQAAFPQRLGPADPAAGRHGPGTRRGPAPQPAQLARSKAVNPRLDYL
jgi:hypothetical protein